MRELQGGAAGFFDSVVIIEEAVLQVALAQVHPNPLDWVEFGRVAQQRHECDVGGDAQDTSHVNLKFGA